MTLRISGKGGENDIAVELTEGGGSISKGRKYRAVDGSGAVGPGQGLGVVPHDSAGMGPGGCGAIAEDRVAAILDIGPGDVDEDGGGEGCGDVNAIELVQSQPGSINIRAFKVEDIEGFVGAAQIELT